MHIIRMCYTVTCMHVVDISQSSLKCHSILLIPSICNVYCCSLYLCISLISFAFDLFRTSLLLIYTLTDFYVSSSNKRISHRFSDIVFAFVQWTNIVTVGIKRIYLCSIELVRRSRNTYTQQFPSQNVYTEFETAPEYGNVSTVMKTQILLIVHIGTENLLSIESLDFGNIYTDIRQNLYNSIKYALVEFQCNRNLWNFPLLLSQLKQKQSIEIMIWQ